MNLFKRRDFLGIGALAISGLALALRKWPQRKKERKTARFLTHDGKLVEVDLNKLPARKTAVTKEKLVSWVWKNNSL